MPDNIVAQKVQYQSARSTNADLREKKSSKKQHIKHLVAGGSSEDKVCIQAKERGHLMTQAVNTVNVQP